jgi:uncharacterized membrane protein YfcA
MKKSSNKFLLVFFGLLTGFANGFFGGGGGMICVPLLIYADKEPVKKAHATAILIILPISIISGLFYYAFGSLDLSLLLKSGSGVVAGGLIGALLLNKLSNKFISILFAVIMLAAGLKLLFW